MAFKNDLFRISDHGSQITYCYCNTTILFLFFFSLHQIEHITLLSTKGCFPFEQGQQNTQFACYIYFMYTNFIILLLYFVFLLLYHHIKSSLKWLQPKCIENKIIETIDEWCWYNVLIRIRTKLLKICKFFARDDKMRSLNFKYGNISQKII